MLRNIADKEGHTIILVTHATNNINNCDYVCFLAPGGFLAYFGRPDEERRHDENEFGFALLKLLRSEKLSQYRDIAETGHLRDLLRHVVLQQSGEREALAAA